MSLYKENTKFLAKDTINYLEIYRERDRNPLTNTITITVIIRESLPHIKDRQFLILCIPCI
jgi:hypothetical protein